MTSSCSEYPRSLHRAGFACRKRCVCISATNIPSDTPKNRDRYCSSLFCNASFARFCSVISSRRTETPLRPSSKTVGAIRQKKMRSFVVSKISPAHSLPVSPSLMFSRNPGNKSSKSVATGVYSIFLPKRDFASIPIRLRNGSFAKMIRRLLSSCMTSSDDMESTAERGTLCESM